MIPKAKHVYNAKFGCIALLSCNKHRQIALSKHASLSIHSYGNALAASTCTRCLVSQSLINSIERILQSKLTRCGGIIIRSQARKHATKACYVHVQTHVYSTTVSKYTDVATFLASGTSTSQESQLFYTKHKCYVKTFV